MKLKTSELRQTKSTHIISTEEALQEVQPFFEETDLTTLSSIQIKDLPDENYNSSSKH